MMRLTVYIVVMALAIFSAGAWAAGPSDTTSASDMPGGKTMSDMPEGKSMSAMGQESGATFSPIILKARDLIGMKVENTQGQNLGKIEDAVLTPDRDRIAYAVLSFGGVLGVGDKLFAVPWSALQRKPGESKELLLNKDKEALKTAPGFDKSNWPSTADASWKQAQTFYGQEETATESAKPETTATTMASIDERRVSKILGTNVNDAQNQKIGDIQDIAFDTHRGHAVFGIIALSSPKPNGADMAAVPWSKVKLNGPKEAAMIDAQQSAIAMVAFKKDNPPNLANREFSKRIYERFQAQPYWDVLGYTAPGGQREGAGRPTGAWAPDSEYNKMFDAKNVQTIKGTVQSTGTFSPTAGSRPGEMLVLKTDDGQTVNVHLGPRSFIQRQNFTFANGDKVEITGCKVNHNGQDVVMAATVDKNGQKLELRDSQGKPQWPTMGSMENMRGKMRDMMQNRTGGTQQQPQGTTEQKAPSNY